MKRVRDPGLSAAAGVAAFVKQPERLLFVLVPMVIRGVRKALNIPENAGSCDYQIICEYVVDSADARLGLEDRLEDLLMVHEPFQDHPECIGDADMTSLPLLLMFICDISNVEHIPRRLTHPGEVATPLATAKRKEFGTWDYEITDGDNTLTLNKGPYKSVHFIMYDSAVVDQAIEEEKLNEL